MAVIGDGTTIPSSGNSQAQESPKNTPTSTELLLSPVPGQESIDITQSLNSSVATAMLDTKEEVEPVDLETETHVSEKKGPIYPFPSGIPGMGNSILGPRIPGSSTRASATIATPLDNTTISLIAEVYAGHIPSETPTGMPNPRSAVRTTKKRKLSASETDQAPAKPDRLPPGSKGIAASITNTEQRLYSGDHHGGHQQPLSLAHIVQSTKNLIAPYTHLHSSCASTKPLQLILASLSSSSFTTTTLMVLLTDSRELLKVLAERQIGVYDKLEPAMGRFQAAGMESILTDAKQKAERTESDVQKLGGWLAQCDAMA
jgi:hypothetical protein